MSPLHLLLALVSLSSLAMGEALAETTQKIAEIRSGSVLGVLYPSGADTSTSWTTAHYIGEVLSIGPDNPTTTTQWYTDPLTNTPDVAGSSDWRDWTQSSSNTAPIGTTTYLTISTVVVTTTDTASQSSSASESTATSAPASSVAPPSVNQTSSSSQGSVPASLSSTAPTASTTQSTSQLSVPGSAPPASSTFQSSASVSSAPNSSTLGQNTGVSTMTSATVSLVTTSRTATVTNNIPENGSTRVETSVLTDQTTQTISNGVTLGGTSSSAGSSSSTNAQSSAASDTGVGTSAASSAVTASNGTTAVPGSSASASLSSSLSSSGISSLSSGSASASGVQTTNAATNGTNGATSSVTSIIAQTNQTSTAAQTSAASMNGTSLGSSGVQATSTSPSSTQTSSIQVGTGTVSPLASTFTTDGLPTDDTDGSTGLVTGKDGVTYTIVAETGTLVQTGLDSAGATVTQTYDTTFLIPSVVGSTEAPDAAPGATSYFATPATTSAFPTCSLTDTFNPFLQTTSCKLAPVWATTTKTYDPWCTNGADGAQHCLCPVCTKAQAECLDKGPPAPGHCKDGWFCDLSQPAGVSTPVFSWDTTSNFDLPWCANTWNTYATCVTAKNKQSCSSISYTTTLTSSTATDSNGSVWIYPYREWKCDDALCKRHSFKVPFPFGWIKLIFNYAFRDHWSCISWFFHGFPPAPKINILPPIGPPEGDWDLEPELISTKGPDGKESPVPENQRTSGRNPTSTPTSSRSSSSSCSTQTFSTNVAICSPVMSGNVTVSTSCSTSSGFTTGCTGRDTTITSTLGCTPSLVPDFIVSCPANFTDSAQCTTNATSTITGCSATTTTIVDSCPLTVDVNDPAIGSILSSWLSDFTFTLTTNTTYTSCGFVMTSAVTIDSNGNGTVPTPVTACPTATSSLAATTTHSTTTSSGSIVTPPPRPTTTFTTTYTSCGFVMTSAVTIDSNGNGMVPTPVTACPTATSSLAATTTHSTTTSSESIVTPPPRPTTTYTITHDSSADAAFSSSNASSLSAISASEASSQATETAAPTPGCSPWLGQEIVLVDEGGLVTELVYVPLDDQMHQAQGDMRSLSCGYEDICHECVSLLEGFRIENVNPEFGQCDVAVSDGQTYTIHSTTPKSGFTFKEPLQLQWIRCKKLDAAVATVTLQSSTAASTIDSTPFDQTQAAAVEPEM